MASYLDEVGDEQASVYDLDGPPETGPLRNATPDVPYGRPRMRHESSHRKLITADQASSKRSRFSALFSTAMSPRLSPRESSRFVDRFRYIICTSQLLSETLVFSEYQKRPSTIHRFKFDDGEQGEWDSRKVAKYWMGSGGCVLLVSLLITWAMRSSNRGIPSKSKNSAALTLALLMALFLYAQSRKGYTRYLHLQAATHIQSTVTQCQRFDALVCKIINLVQEVELVSRGYRTGSTLPPIARIEANGRQRRCMRLRTSLVAALNLVFSANGRASAILEKMANARDYNKLSDVYNVILTEEDDLALLCDEADSVGYLKALFHQMHARRRKLLCCLLAIHADGRPGSTGVWGTVVKQLQSISGLMENLVQQFEDVLEEDTHVLSPNQIAWSSATEASEGLVDRRRAQARGINTLSQTLRRTQAKMYILREESARILQQPDIEPQTKVELLSHYDSLGSDLNALLADWQDGRQLLLRQSPPESPTDEHPPQGAEDSSSVPRTSDIDLDGESLLIRPNSLGFWGPRMSVVSGPVTEGHPFTPIGDALREEVFEGDTAVTERPLQRMTRAERVAIMRQERELKQARSEERRVQQQARLSLQGELKDVLGHPARRPLGLRLSVHNMQRPSAALESPSSTGPTSSQSPTLLDAARKVSTSSQQSTNTINSALGSSVASNYDY